jgi:putative thioredoxin
MNNSPYIIEITEDNYQDYVVEQSHRVPVLVDFWASWCQPCQMLMPILAKLAEDYQGKFILAKINTEEQQSLATRFGIRSIPTVKLFRNGEPVDEFAGALPEAEIRQFLDRHIPRESDALVDQAGQLLQQGEGKSALELLEQAKISDPANGNIDLALARTHAALGDPVSAEQILKQLPADMRDQPEVRSLAARLFFESLLRDAPTQTELMQRLDADDNDAEAMYLLAAHHVNDQHYEQAADLLLQLMKKERSWGDDAARKALLKLFDVLGDDPVVPRYRSKMMSLIY